MYSLMSKRMNSLPRSSASCLASSVLPTPVGPVKRNAPVGRSGWPSPARERLIACAPRLPALGLPEDAALERLLERAQPLAVGRRGLSRGNPRGARRDHLDVGDV